MNIARVARATALALACTAGCVNSVDDPVSEPEAPPTPAEGTVAMSEPEASDEDANPEDAKADEDAPETSDFDVKRYDVRAELDWERHRLVATVGITLRLVDPRLSSVTFGSAVSEVKAVRFAGRPLRHTVDTAHSTLRVDLPARHLGMQRAPRTFRIEIDYEAEATVASQGPDDRTASFYMMPHLRGDPVPGHTAVTISEPTNAIRWLPCHDVPADRAIFSLDMRLPTDEKLIANGNFISDRPDGKGRHRIRYDSGFTLPTYVMSFAAGHFEVETRHRGLLPVSIWHRPGLVADYDRVFAETFRALDVYESLFGTYPFKTYATVFAQFYWGMENATMSVVGEKHVDYALAVGNTTALHELSHQWFGDLVSPETWDENWIKEGMAVLLEMESQRIYLDESGKHTLGGDRRAPTKGHAIREPLRDPRFKGPGPYGRAPWLLTQIRSVIGETAFWSTLRRVLRQYRFSSLGTDAFIDAFAPHLGDDLTARVRRAVDVRSIPRLEVQRTTSGPGAFVTLRDPDGSLIAPVTVRWVAEDGTARDQVLEIGARVELSPRATGEFLVIDPLDVHPDLTVFAAEAGPDSAKNYQAAVIPMLVPDGARATAQWLDVGGIHQLAVLSKAWPDVTPDAFDDFVKDLDSEGAKALAIQWACETAADPHLDTSTRDAWSNVLARTLSAAPRTMGLTYLGAKRYTACSKVVDIEEVFAEDWVKLVREPAKVAYPRIVYLTRFQLPPERAFSVWSSVAKHGSSLLAREQAAARLVRDARFAGPNDLSAWRSFFARLLTESQNDSMLYSAVDGVLATRGASPGENADAVAGLNAVLHDPLDYWDGYVHSYALCGAFRLLDDSSAAQRFVDGLADAGLRPEIRALAANPSRCDSVLP